MAQWTVKNLTVLILVFGIFLVTFNISAIPFENKKKSIPFSFSNQIYRAIVHKTTFFNYPLVVKAIPPTNSKANLSIWCGLLKYKNDILISLNSDYNIGYSLNCPNITIELSPIQENTSIWLQIQNHSSSMILEITQYVFLLALILTFILYYIKRKSRSTQRSTVIIILSSIFMLRPLSALMQVTDILEPLNKFLFIFGLFRFSIELFSEYSPLVRQSQKVYKIVCAVPAAFLFLFECIPNDLIQILPVSYMGTLVGLIVPVVGVVFLFMAGNTTGKFSLIIQIMSGSLVSCAVFYIRMLCIIDVFYDSSFIIHIFEISIIASYAMFQAIIKSGETVEEEEMSHISHNKVHRYDKIDEILNDLVGEDDVVKFEEDL